MDKFNPSIMLVLLLVIVIVLTPTTLAVDWVNSTANASYLAVVGVDNGSAYYSTGNTIYKTNDSGVSDSSVYVSGIEAISGLTAITGGETVRVADENYYESTNGGGSFSQVSGVIETVNTVGSDDGNYILVGTYSSAFWLSTNGGSNYTRMTSVLTDRVFAMDMSSDGQFMVVSAQQTGETFYSSDYGSTWNATANITGTDVRDLAISEDGQIIYAVVSLGSVFVSTNAGISWSVLDSELTSGLSYYSVDCNDDCSVIGVSAVNGNGFWLSENSGANWSNELLGSFYWTDFSPDGTELWVAGGNAPTNHIYKAIIPIPNSFLIDSCRTITASGEYNLTQNISGAGCLNIPVPDVVINAGDYEIDGGITSALSISSSADNVTINGGVFRGATDTGTISIATGSNQITINGSEVYATGNFLYFGIKAISITDLTVDNSVISVSGTGSKSMYGSRFRNLIVRDSVLTGYESINFFSDTNDNWLIDNVTMNGGQYQHLRISDGEVRNSRFNGGNAGLQTVYDPFVVGNVFIHDNEFLGMGTAISGDSQNVEVYDNEFTPTTTIFSVGSGVFTAYNNTFNTTATMSLSTTINLNKSTSGNTWTNPASNGFSDTCLNDGFGVCEEDNVIGNSTDYEPIAFSLYCASTFVCDGYGTGTCLLNDTDTASCNSVNDTNSCGRIYSGDFSEFLNQTGICDSCTPSFSCDGFSAGVCNITSETSNDTCNSVNDGNGCFALTGLGADQYAGNFSEFPDEINACNVSNTARANYLMGALILIIPLIFILSLLFSSRFGNKLIKDKKISNLTTTLLIVVIVVMLLTLL